MTTTRDVLAAVRSALTAASEFNDSQVIIAPPDRFPMVGRGADMMAVVWPGVGEYIESDHDYYIAQEISVTVYKRLSMDQAGYDTQKLTHASESVLLSLDDVFDTLNGSLLSANLVSPMIPVRIEAPASAPEGIVGDWIKIAGVWRCGYGVTYG